MAVPFFKRIWRNGRRFVFNTPPRMRHTVMGITVLSHQRKVPLTHHHGSIMVLKRTMYLGDLKVLRVCRIATIPLCQNLRGRQSVPLTRHHGSTLVPTRRYILGIAGSSTVTENACPSLYSPEAIWCVSQKDSFAVSLQ